MKTFQIFFEKTKNWQIALIIFFFGLILYSNTFGNQLFWDDYESIVNNQYIRDWNYFSKYFSENLTAGSGIRDNYWRPLLLVSFSLDYHIAGLSPFIYHLQNFLWHFLSAFLVYLIIVKLFKNLPLTFRQNITPLKNNLLKSSFSQQDPASSWKVWGKLLSFLAALIFLAHPLQTEAVSYAAGRADPMQATLLLASFWFFLEYVWKKVSSEYLVFSLIFFSAALLTKERAIVFPAILTVYFFTLYPEKMTDNWQKKVKIILPFFAITFVYFILRLTSLHFTDTFDLGQPNNIGAANFEEKLLIYFKGISVYFGLLFWPAKLYMEKTIVLPKSVFDLSVISGFVLTTLSIMTIFYSLKNRKIVAFGMLWFWISFAPSFYIYPIQGLLYEHWLYFPLIGLLICFLVPLFDYLSKQSLEIKKMFILSLLIVFILGLGIRTIIRNSNWHDPINFYEKNVSLGGYSGRVYTNLGMAYADAGRNQEAIDTYQKSIRINADLFQTWYDMGNTFTAMGKNDEAIDSYQKAIEKNPYFVPAYNTLSKIFSDQKKFDAAIQILQKAIEKNPKNIQLLYNLGVTSSQKGDRIQAKKYFQEALSLQPTNIDLIRAFNGI